MIICKSTTATIIRPLMPLLLLLLLSSIEGGTNGSYYYFIIIINSVNSARGTYDCYYCFIINNSSKNCRRIAHKSFVLGVTLMTMWLHKTHWKKKNKTENFVHLLCVQ